MDIRAISILQEYIADMPEPRKKCKKQVFLQETYSRWAAEEILKYIQENESRPPVAVVEEFKDRMNHYSLMNRNSSYIFSVAYDIAMDILDIFLAMSDPYLGYLKEEFVKRDEIERRNDYETEGNKKGRI